MIEMNKDYYKILGVDKDASQDEIKKAYRKLSKQWHPDLNHSPEAKDKFAEINEAYEVLSNPEKRSEYDNPSPFGGFGGQGMNGFRDSDGNFHFTWSSDGSQGGFNPFDAFSDFFGGMGGMGGFRRPDPNAPRPGEDILLVLNVGFIEAINGCTKKVRLNVQDNQDGKRVPKTITLEVKIPSGAYDGLRLRVAGQGNRGYNGGPNGDIFFQLNISEHEVFIRDGYDLIEKIDIPFETFVLGGKIKVKVLDDDKIVENEHEISPNTKPGKTLVFRGKGVHIINSLNNKGDLRVMLNLVMPENLTDKELELLKQYRDERKSHSEL